jgi:hypothetical protein
MRRGLFPLLAVLAAGCGGGGTDTGKAPPAGTPGTIELTQVTVAELDQVIASHKGNVVLIDVWFLG